MTRLHFTPSKRTPGNWWMRFNPKSRGAKDLARKVVGDLAQAGIRRIWKETNDAALNPQKLARRAARQLAKENRKGQQLRGLNVQREAKRENRRAARKKIIQIQLAQEHRLDYDALKRAREKRRQADQLAQREVNEHVREVLKRAKGEV